MSTAYFVYCCSQLAPVGAVAFRVNAAVERREAGAQILDEVQDFVAVSCPQVERVEGHRRDERRAGLDDFRAVGDSGEYRRGHDADLDARSAQRLHRRELARGACGVRLGAAAKIVVSRAEREHRLDAREFPKNIDVARNERGLRNYHDVGLRWDERAQERARHARALFVWIVGVCHRREEDAAAVELREVRRRGGTFHVEVRAPRLAALRRAAHARGVAVDAAVRAADVWVYHEVRAELRRREQAFYLYVTYYDHDAPPPERRASGAAAIFP